MEINEMKNLWKDMSEKLDKQIELSEQVLLESTKEQYTRRVNIFWNAQIIGFVVAYGILIFLAFNFYKLDSWQELTSAILWCAYLGIMPFYSIAGMKTLKNINIGKMSFKECLEAFTSGKERTLRAQKISLILNPILFVAAVILIPILVLNIDSSTLVGNPLIIAIITIVLLGTMVATHWVYKKNNIHLESLREFMRE